MSVSGWTGGFLDIPPVVVAYQLMLDLDGVLSEGKGDGRKRRPCEQSQVIL